MRRTTNTTADGRPRPPLVRRRSFAASAGSGDREVDRGVTFIEIVVTIVLLGLVIVPIITAVRVSIDSSSTASDAAELETLLVNAVDRITRADRTEYPCNLSGPPTAAVETAGWDQSQLVVVQHYLDASGHWVLGNCPSSPPPPGLVQRVTLTLTHPEHPITRTLQVVKGDV